MGLLPWVGFGHGLVDFSLGFAAMGNEFADRWCGKVGINGWGLMGWRGCWQDQRGGFLDWHGCRLDRRDGVCVCVCFFFFFSWWFLWWLFLVIVVVGGGFP